MYWSTIIIDKARVLRKKASKNSLVISGLATAFQADNLARLLRPLVRASGHAVEAVLAHIEDHKAALRRRHGDDSALAVKLDHVGRVPAGHTLQGLGHLWRHREDAALFLKSKISKRKKSESWYLHFAENLVKAGKLLARLLVDLLDGLDLLAGDLQLFVLVAEIVAFHQKDVAAVAEEGRVPGKLAAKLASNQPKVQKALIIDMVSQPLWKNCNKCLLVSLLLGLTWAIVSLVGEICLY